MYRLKIALVSSIIGLGTLFTALAPIPAQADSAWQPTVVVSSSLARFEATPTGYDATTGKYKYQFSWLMPKYRVYSFAIDGKGYRSRVLKNGTAETPFWFSPDVTYHIQIYGSASSRGKLVGEGTFTAPPVTPPTQTLTLDQEYDIAGQYYLAAPILPTQKVKSPDDVKAITAMLVSTQDINTFSGVHDHWSSKTKELLNQTPLLLESLDKESMGNTGMVSRSSDIIILKGKQNAYISVTGNDPNGKQSTGRVYFIKENGEWKIDLIQMIKDIVDKTLTQ